MELKSNMTKTVIIGGSHAAVAAAAKLRELDEAMEIIIISEEDELPYQRPPLSKNYMSGALPFERLSLRPKEWFDDQNIDLRLGVAATAVDSIAKQITLANGEAVSYDKLLLATGASARRLPAVIGGELPNVRVMRSLSDANWLMGEMQEGKNLVVIGGGYIGLEAAAEAVKKGLKVTVIEAADRILKRVACQETADFFRNLHQSNDVRILENTQLEHIVETDGMASSVLLADGESLPLDFVIVGIGVNANVELAEAAGLNIDNGIAVDEYCRTSNADIYSVGDCVTLPFKQMPTRLESVQNANDQAVIAAINIAGGESIYTPYPWFWSDQYTVKLQIAGFNRGYDKVSIRQGKREGSISHFYFAEQKLIAVDSMNDPATYAMVRKLLEAGSVIMPEQIASADLDLRAMVKALAN